VRITQVGTGNAFVVEDSTNPDLTPFVIDAIGRVSIGTSSTVANLEVMANGANGILLGKDINSTQSSRLFFSNGTDGQHVAILNSNSGGMDFRTLATAGSTTGTQRMIIQSTGEVYIAQNVGINQPSPNARLHAVASSTQSGMIISGSTPVELVRFTQTGTGSALIVEDSTNPDSTPFVVDATGNVGIGTSTPAEKLQVVGTASVTGFRMSTGAVNGYVLTTDASGNATWQVSSGGGSPLSGTVNYVPYYTSTTALSSTSSIYIGTEGNVGIGTTTPAAKLDVRGSSGIIINASASTTSDLVRLTQTGTGNAFVVEDSANPDSTPFVITNSGRVKIGTTSDSPYSSNIYSISSTYGLEAFGNIAGVYARGLTYGIVAEAATDGMVVAGIMASATNDSAFFGSYYGGLFSANSSNNVNYSVRLQDGSQGKDKVLVDTTGDGSANWRSDLNLTSIIASASSTGDIVRITQTGTGNAIVVEDSANPDSTPFVINNSGNVGIGTTNPVYPLQVSGTVSTTAIRITQGAVNGYVLTSDASGNATWASGGGGGGGTTVTNYGDNRIVTSDGTSTGLNAESNMTFDGGQVNVTGSMKLTGTFSGNNSNFVQSELITQTVLLYMSNNT
jgi:hypothetical protein